MHKKLLERSDIIRRLAVNIHAIRTEINRISNVLKNIIEKKQYQKRAGIFNAAEASEMPVYSIRQSQSANENDEWFETAELIRCYLDELVETIRQNERSSMGWSRVSDSVFIDATPKQVRPVFKKLNDELRQLFEVNVPDMNNKCFVPLPSDGRRPHSNP